MNYTIIDTFFIKQRNILSIAFDKEVPNWGAGQLMLIDDIAFECGSEFTSGPNVKHNSVWIHTEDPSIVAVGKIVKLISLEQWNKPFYKLQPI